MARIIRFVFYILVLLLALSFAVLNADSVLLNYHFGSWRIPLSLALVVFMALGALFGIIASLGLVMKLKSEINSLRRTAKHKEAEVINLRALPLKDTE